MSVATCFDSCNCLRMMAKFKTFAVGLGVLEITDSYKMLIQKLGVHVLMGHSLRS